VQEKRKVAASLGIPAEAVELLEQLPKEACKQALDLFVGNLRNLKKLGERHTGEVATFTDQLAKSFDHPGKQTPSPSASDASPVGDPTRRRQRTDEEIHTARTEEPPESQRSRVSARKIWESKNPEVRAFLKVQYNGHCQICGETFLERNGENYFEARYLVSRTDQGGGWLDRPGNVLCLCPTCCAKIQHASIESPENIVDELCTLKLSREGGTQPLTVLIHLCHERVIIRFTEKHLLDLQQMLAADTKEKASPNQHNAPTALSAPPGSTLTPKPAAPSSNQPMGNSGLVQCPKCHVQVRVDRLQQHLLRVHSSGPTNAETVSRSISVGSSSLRRCRCGNLAVPGDDYCYNCK
jgi:hypothetical protein